MKKILVLLAVLAFAAALVACGKGGSSSSSSDSSKSGDSVVTSSKKYDVKSGIVEYETSAMGISMKKILSFDDFGAKECEENFFDGKLTETKFCDEKTIYTYRADSKDKIVYSRSGSYGLSPKVTTANVKGHKSITIMPDMTVCGKACETYAQKHRDTVITMAGYKGVHMFMEQTGKTKVKMTAVKADFDVAVPADKFKAPAGWTVKPM